MARRGGGSGLRCSSGIRVCVRSRGRSARFMRRRLTTSWTCGSAARCTTRTTARVCAGRVIDGETLDAAGVVSRGAAVSEEPERWPPAADEAEVQRRMQAVFTERMEALPPAEWEAVAAATNPTRVAEPFGD